MNIIASANSKYMRYLYVMLTSLFENNRDETVCVYVMNRDFTDKDKGSISDLTIKYGQKVEFLFVDETRFTGLPTSEKFSLETYFRLMMAELLPRSIDKVLYLDVDIIVRCNLRDLYDTSIDDYIAAVCLDSDHPTLTNAKARLFNRRDDMRYFNAGVMLWNIRKLRENYSFQKFLEGARELGFQLQCADQEILNYMLYDQVLYLDSNNYNYLVRGFQDEPDISVEVASILHYATYSPWQDGPKSTLYRFWWQYAKTTPFYTELLEEQLWKESGIAGQNSDRRLQDIMSMEIYEEAFRLKSSGLIKSFFDRSGEYIGIYGAGTMGEVIYELLVSDNSWERVKFVVDRNRIGNFHEVKVVDEVCSDADVIWIVTPTLHTAELVKSISSESDVKIRAVALRDWLKGIT